MDAGSISLAGRWGCYFVAIRPMEGLGLIRYIIEVQMPAELIRLVVDCEAQSLGLRCDCCKLVLEFGHAAVIELPIGIKTAHDVSVTKIVSLQLELYKFLYKGFATTQSLEDFYKFSQGKCGRVFR